MSVLMSGAVRAVTAAGDTGAVNVWRDDAGKWRADMQRRMHCLSKTTVEALTDLRPWLEEWWPQMHASTEYLTQSDVKAREIEREFAYLWATGAIEGDCKVVERSGAQVFYDISHPEVDVREEVEYLRWRRLLDIHPEHKAWISMRDESEPLAEGQGGY